MGITLVEKSYSGNASGDLTINKPTGTVQGDILVIVIVEVGVTGYSNPSGWTDITNINNGTALRMKVAWRRAGASEGVNYVFTRTGGGATTGIMTALRGCIEVGSIDGTFTAQANASSTTIDYGSITTGDPSSLVFAATGLDSGEDLSSISGTTPTLTEWSDNTPLVPNLGISTGTLATPGATSARTATVGVASLSITAVLEVKAGILTPARFAIAVDHHAALTRHWERYFKDR